MGINKIKVAVSGACGRMGQEVVKAVLGDNDLELAAAIDVTNVGKDIGEVVLKEQAGVNIESSLKEALISSKADVVVDFTSPDNVFGNVKTALEANVRPVVGTTGLSEAQLEELKKLSQSKNLSALVAPNFTTGAVLMMMFAKTAAKYFDNAEIIELHHNKKKDAPSGTAIKTAQMMAESNNDFTKGNVEETELIKCARGANAEANIHIHSVRMPGFMAHQEVIFGALGQVLTIRHDSFERTCYMPGVIMAIKNVMGHSDFIYGLENIL